MAVCRAAGAGLHFLGLGRTHTSIGVHSATDVGRCSQPGFHYVAWTSSRAAAT